MSQPIPAAETFLPSVERARTEGLVARAKLWLLPIATDLLGRTPTEQHAVAAVVLRARVERRNVEQRVIQLPTDEVLSLPANPKPAPKGFVTERHRYLIERDPGPSDCEVCELKPGQMPCVVCGGTGVIHTTDAQGNQVTRSCYSCKAGFVTCTTCAGSGTAVHCTVGVVDDHEASLDYTYVPAMTLDLELAVGALLDAEVQPPDCLKVGFELKTARSAYRGATKQVEAKHLGHHYGTPLDSARSAVRGLGLPGEFVGHDIQVFAWPILWLRYGGIGGRHDVALVVDPNGKLQAFVD
jgi:hypothetical protein